MPNVHYLPHQPSAPLGVTETQKKIAIWSCVGLGVIALGGLLWTQFGSKPKRLSSNGRKKMFGRNGKKRHCRNGCRGAGGPYLFPEDQAYPVPTLRCAKTALAYASWPNNIDSAPAVIRAMKKSKWGGNAEIKAGLKKLASKYAAEKHAKKPRV